LIHRVIFVFTCSLFDVKLYAENCGVYAIQGGPYEYDTNEFVINCE